MVPTLYHEWFGDVSPRTRLVEHGNGIFISDNIAASITLPFILVIPDQSNWMKSSRQKDFLARITFLISLLQMPSVTNLNTG